MPELKSSIDVSWSKVIWTVLIILLVAGVIGGFLFWYFLIREPVSPTTTTKQATTSANPATPSTQKDVIADWKNYTSGSIGFQIKYPVEAKIEAGSEVAKNRMGPLGVEAVQFDIWGPKQGPNTQLSDAMRVVIATVENPNQLNLRDFADQNSMAAVQDPTWESRLSFKKSTIDNKESYEADMKGVMGEYTLLYLSSKNSDQMIKIYITCVGDRAAEYKNISDLMLSTFKFL
ncbi:MAG: hypothetical protein A2126_03210 [Candidatus Woykebacteria bacterium GWB1_45_5]|uniref:PsbP C-terminal domain-containing protein n=2 Tax=Candidatus Woykeibacteriota TaxID=1817899 RepID=A0A1G1W1T6_9BACT|nr:MAG: hypothetical protein A2113_03705 [Candidatus Woykebacteria bacterium GWA1_44_8]OGY23586.1 MAG: hypothetical protein A2126_03210 [Candidatus Woykebacteria bacterium GWB1_45_5]